MKVVVLDDDGSTMFESDDRSMMGMAPGFADRERVVKALIDAGVQLALGKLPPADDKAVG